MNIWQLPQNLIGRLVKKIFKAEFKSTYKDANIYVWDRDDGISLGSYIFVPRYANETFIKHEYGHTLQSKKLGWLYLFVISIPSLIWAGCFEGYRRKHNVSYYSFAQK